MTEPLVQTRRPFEIKLGRGVGPGSLLLDQKADAVSIVSRVSQRNRARTEVMRQ